MRQQTGWVAAWGVAVALVTGSACGSETRPTPIQPQTAGPVIGLVSPSQGLSTEATPIRITGSGFQTGATVRIGETLTPAVVESPTTIAASAPPRDIGQVDLVVTNPDGRFGRLTRAFTYMATIPRPAWDGRIRPGDSVTSTLADAVVWCTFESVACQRLFVDAPPSETIELELTAAESGRFIGLYLEEPFLAPTTYPKRLTVAGGQRPTIMGEQVGYTLTARRAGSTHSVSWTAGDACPVIPAEARQRRYDATIENGLVTLRTGTFLDGSVCTFGTGLGCHQFRLDQMGNDVRVLIRNPDEWHGGEIVERLPSGAWLSLTGEGSGRVDGTTIRASVNANLWYCPGNQSSPFPCHTYLSCQVPNLEMTITGYQTITGHQR